MRYVCPVIIKISIVITHIYHLNPFKKLPIVGNTVGNIAWINGTNIPKIVITIDVLISNSSYDFLVCFGEGKSRLDRL